ncbi:MAG: glutathione S-transferase family protein [Candidatus Binatia bacterium]|nr:glutathione S-transferase family protein [Candidatus Binatia bacterium]MDG2009316.1 glutathione S-transferase family protein [Candidatus Binatia bacterium]
MNNAPSQKTLTFMGAPGSPYTRKMRAVLRYRHIPSRMIQQMSAEHKSRPQPRIPLLPTFYLPDAEGNEVAVTDSTPLIRRFEQEYAGRSIVPDNPVLAMLNDMLEDFGDEWLTKAMFHYRWAFQADVDKAASILPRWIKTNASDEEVAPLSKFIADRQIERLSYVGSNPITAPVIEEGYRRFLKLFSAHLAGTPFLFGDRPASADFALYGQLTCLVLFDPTPMAICVKEEPRVYAWVEHMEDLSGVEPASGDWVQPEALGPTFHALLCEFGRVYAPYLLANAEAVASGAEKVETTIDGAAWEQNPFPYQKKCLQVLRDSRKSMTPKDREALDQILSGTGAEVIFAE